MEKTLKQAGMVPSDDRWMSAAKNEKQIFVGLRSTLLPFVQQLCILYHCSQRLARLTSPIVCAGCAGSFPKWSKLEWMFMLACVVPSRPVRNCIYQKGTSRFRNLSFIILFRVSSRASTYSVRLWKYHRNMVNLLEEEEKVPLNSFTERCWLIEKSKRYAQ